MRVVASVTVLLLVALVLSGCASTKSESSSLSSTGSLASTGAHGGTSGSGASSPKASSSASPSASSAAARVLTFTASPLTGMAPANVTFHLDSTDKDNATSWRLAFGDGQAANGTGAQLPADRLHAFVVAGNFTPVLTVVYGDGLNRTARLNLTVTAAPTGPAPPLVFTFGASKAGCVGDVHSFVSQVPLNCVNFQGGPSSPQVDGFWQPLDDRYVGRSFTSTIATSNPLPDSDCYFVAPDAKTIVGDCTNGGNPAAGTVPAGTGWMFIYSYAAPSSSIVVTFT